MFASGQELETWVVSGMLMEVVMEMVWLGAPIEEACGVLAWVLIPATSLVSLFHCRSFVR